MAGGKKQDVIKLAEKRDKALKQANVYYTKMRKLESMAEEIDYKISDLCHHPKSHLKLKNFSDTRTFWLCTLCYQTVDLNQDALNKKLDDMVKDLFDDIWDELPEDSFAK